MTNLRKFGRWEPVNVLATAVFFAAVPVTAWAVYQIAQKGSCGGRFQPACDTVTGNLVTVVIGGGILTIGLGQWILLGHHVFFGWRIPARQFVGTYLVLAATALCVGIIATRDSPVPRLIFALIVVVAVILEAIRIARLPAQDRTVSVLRAADVPLNDSKRQERAKPWTGPLTRFEIAHYTAMALGTLAGPVFLVLL